MYELEERLAFRRFASMRERPRNLDRNVWRMRGKRLGQTGKSGGDVKTIEVGGGQTHGGW